MKIRIDTPMARLAADLTEEQVAAILRIALDYASGGSAQMPADIGPAIIPTKIIIPQEKPKLTTPEEGYKGFLYIKCEACGETKGFCVKSPIKESRCDCGHVTELKDLKPMYLNCKCGDSFKYRTNLTEKTVSMNCIHCGTPVDLEYHDKKDVYRTIE